MRHNKRETFMTLRNNDTQWLTQEGIVIEIQEMNNNHIINTIDLIREHQKIAGDKDMISIPDLMIKRYLSIKETHPELFI